jgi:hypothetical protein
MLAFQARESLNRSMTPAELCTCLETDSGSVESPASDEQYSYPGNRLVKVVAKMRVAAWSEGRSVRTESRAQIFLRLASSQLKLIRIEFLNCQRQHHLETTKTTRYVSSSSESIGPVRRRLTTR